MLQEYGPRELRFAFGKSARAKVKNSNGVHQVRSTRNSVRRSSASVRRGGQTLYRSVKRFVRRFRMLLESVRLENRSIRTVAFRRSFH